MKKYASPSDGQPQLRTKVSEHIYKAVVDYAEARGLTLYLATRELLIIGLRNAEKGRCSPPKPPEGDVQLRTEN